MEISGIGGVGSTAGMAGTAGVSAAGTTAATGGCAPAGTVPAGMQSLVQSLQDHTSAEILLALMILSALRKEDDKSGGGAALGLLVGLAMAGQIGRTNPIDLQLPISDISATAGGGGNLNVLV